MTADLPRLPDGAAVTTPHETYNGRVWFTLRNGRVAVLFGYAGDMLLKVYDREQVSAVSLEDVR